MACSSQQIKTEISQEPRVGASVKVAAKVNCSSTFEKLSSLSELGKRTEVS